MKLEDIGNWVESEQYRKILEIMQQAPVIVQQLRKAGIFKDDSSNTAEELKNAFDNENIEFKQIPSENKQPRYDLLIKNGVQIIQNIPWSELAQAGVNPMSVATLGISIHNAVMLHKISRQIKQLDAKVDKVLEGQQQDREAICESALDLLEQAKNYSDDKQRQDQLLMLAVREATSGYKTIRRVFFNVLGQSHAERKEFNDLLSQGVYTPVGHVVKKVLLFSEPLLEWGVDTYKKKVFKDKVNEKQNTYKNILINLQNQWNYLCLSIYVQTMTHILLENQAAVNACLDKFRTEIFEKIDLDNIPEHKKIRKQFTEQFNAIYMFHS